MPDTRDPDDVDAVGQIRLWLVRAAGEEGHHGYVYSAVYKAWVDTTAQVIAELSLAMARVAHVANFVHDADVDRAMHARPVLTFPVIPDRPLPDLDLPVGRFDG